MARANILVVNSCLPPCFIGVILRDRALPVHTADPAIEFSSEGMVLVDRALTAAGIAVADLNALAFVAGPGSFTGIRIGLSLIKGMAFGRDLPMALLGSLELLAAPFFNTTARQICPVIDAHLGEVYSALYSPQGVELTPPRALAPEALVASLAGEILWAGLDALRFREKFSGVNGEFDAPGAEMLAETTMKLGQERVLEGKMISARDAQPLYLRESYAEMKRA